MSSLSERTYYISDIITFVQFTKTGRGEPDFLYHQSDGAFLQIRTGNRQRHTFSLVAYTYNDEVAGFAGFSN